LERFAPEADEPVVLFFLLVVRFDALPVRLAAGFFRAFATSEAGGTFDASDVAVSFDRVR
jgi:hypothetical protein